MNGTLSEAFFLVVGNVEFLKGFDLIAAGLSCYRCRGGKGMLKVAGTTGPTDPNPQVQDMLNTPAVRKLMRSTENQPVEFLGKLSKDRLAEMRARCAAVVIGSRFESFSMVAGEALMSHCPVILSDRSGLRGLAERFHGARLFSPYDPEDLAEAMFEVEDPARRAALQEGGDRIAAYLSSEELIGKTVSFYRGLLQ
jgi:glycosyltransferase involved in cell wall biosynthesis